MRLILARSLDGYLARGPKDDMAWTGEADKHIFRLLTSVGGTCLAGRRTWEQLPHLPGRRVLPIGRRSEYAQNDLTGSVEKTLTLGQAYYLYGDAWLLGGPTVGLEALDMCLVDQVYMVEAPVVLVERGSAFPPKGLISDHITPWLMSRGEQQNAGAPWRRVQRIPFAGGATVDCWSRHDGERPKPRN